MTALTPILSILTPTYNRRHTLGRLYDSIARQGRSDVEWVVIDDGSEDGTAEYLEALQESASFGIVFRMQQNAGRAWALNAGIPLCRGRYAMFMDSDDWLTDDALALVLGEWETAEGDAGLAAVVGLCVDPDGKLIGSRFPDAARTSDFVAIRSEHGVTGDKKEVFRGDVLRSHLFPTTPGEKRVPTSLILHRMAKHYRARFVNSVVCVKEYHPDGMSATIDRIRMRSPNSSRLRYVEALRTHALPPRALFRNASNAFRYSLHARVPLPRQVADVGGWKWLLGLPFGIALYVRDGLRHRKPVAPGVTAPQRER